MQAGNAPTVPAASEGDTLKPHSYLVARALAETHGDASWDKVLKVSAEADGTLVGTVADQRRRLGTWADSPKPWYFLTVLDRKVQVLYGWQACRPLDAEGKLFAGFMGDRRHLSSGVEVGPRLYRGAGEANDQYKLFSKVKGYPLTMAKIQAGYAASDATALLGAKEGADAVELEVWGALRVHPKLASVFMHSPTVKQALDVFVKINQMVPAESLGDLDAVAEPTHEHSWQRR